MKKLFFLLIPLLLTACYSKENKATENFKPQVQEKNSEDDNLITQIIRDYAQDSPAICGVVDTIVLLFDVTNDKKDTICFFSCEPNPTKFQSYIGYQGKMKIEEYTILIYDPQKIALPYYKDSLLCEAPSMPHTPVWSFISLKGGKYKEIEVNDSILRSFKGLWGGTVDWLLPN